MAQVCTGNENNEIIRERKIHVLLADHLKLVRESLRHAIHDGTNDMELIECDSFEGALHNIREYPHINLAIFALRLPGMRDLSEVQKVRMKYRDLPIAIISAFYQYADILKAFECGASGFLSKEMDSCSIISAVRFMLTGERFVPSEVLESFEGTKKKILSAGVVDPLQELTDREMEVLDLLMSGHSNKSIARLLSVEEVTVKMHIGKILRKLHAENRAHAVAISFRARCKHCSNPGFWE